MIVTRKIEIIPCGNKQERSETMKQLYNWRNLAKKAANAIVSHKFVQQNIKDFTYLKDEIAEKFYIKDIIKEEPGMSEQNVTYRIISDMIKDRMPSNIRSTLNHEISSTFNKRVKDFEKGDAGIPYYRNIPIPFTANSLKISPFTKKKQNGEDFETYILDFFHLPFELFFGKDRSGNRNLIERGLKGEIKFCGSAIQICDGDMNKGKSRKIFLLLSLDIPEKETQKIAGKTLYAILDVTTPIICSTSKSNLESASSKIEPSEEENRRKVFYIGNKEEFLHRRIQIQEALHRCQENCKYNKGGHGRKAKLSAIDRYHELEKNYIDYKTHVYSRELVRIAEKNQCEAIYLIAQKEKETEAKKEEFLLRNWSYHDLKTKICYKAKMSGIEVIIPNGKEE